MYSHKYLLTIYFIVLVYMNHSNTVYYFIIHPPLQLTSHGVYSHATTELYRLYNSPVQLTLHGIYSCSLLSWVISWGRERQS